MRLLRILLLPVGLFLATACVDDEAHLGHGFVVGAPEEFLGATVFLNGKEVARFQHLDTHGGIFETLMKKIYGDSPVFHVVAATVDLSETALQPGEHVLRVEKPGRPPALGRFSYPFEGDQFKTFWVEGAKIETAMPPPANSTQQLTRSGAGPAAELP